MTKTYTTKPNIIVSMLRELSTRSMSLSELLEVMDASFPTTRRALRELERKGFVHIIGTRESTGGRPANIYGINGDGGYAIGVHLELPQIHFVTINLVGEIIEHHQISRDYNLNSNQAIQEIIRYVGHIRQVLDDEKVVGLGIAAPGYLDELGTVLTIGRDPAWHNVPLATRLHQETNVPVLITNDVDCMALAELEFNKFSIPENFLYLGFTEGVKASLILNGDFYAGPYGNAGSIGHTTVVPEGLICSCGNQGCLETVASLRAAHHAFDQKYATVAHVGLLADISNIENRIERFYAICDAAASGESVCNEVVSNMLSYLSIAIANLVNIFQVRLIVIGGLLSQLPVPLQIELDNLIRNRLINLLRDNLTIRFARDDRVYNAAIGAAQHTVGEYLSAFVIRKQGSTRS